MILSFFCPAIAMLLPCCGVLNWCPPASKLAKSTRPALQHCAPASVRAREPANAVNTRDAAGALAHASSAASAGRTWLLLLEESENVEIMAGLAQHKQCLCRLVLILVPLRCSRSSIEKQTRCASPRAKLRSPSPRPWARHPRLRPGRSTAAAHPRNAL